MLTKLIHPSRKKIQKARKVYEIYCQVNSLAKTREATGLGVGTIRRYIALAEDLNNISKISTKDRYYNNKDINNNYKESPPPLTADYINKNIESQEENRNTLEIDRINTESQIEIDEADGEVFTDNKLTNLNELKNKLLVAKLTNISQKYLDYLDTPTEQQLRKTSLKDHAVIAGILLDKKILIEHKQSDVIKNQSIIFNLFGSNTSLSKFISDSLDRQAKLRAKPVKKYEIAVNK
jgi:hypothetical protein